MENNQDIPYKFKPVNISEKTVYHLQASQSIEVNGTTDLTNLTNYQIELSIAPGRGEQLYIEFSTPVFNNRIDYTKWQWLFCTVFSIYQKMVLSLNPEGSIDQIHNQEEIIEKWKNVRKKIRTKYEHASVRDIIRSCDECLANDLTFTIQQDPFFSFVFKDLFHNYYKQVITRINLKGHFGNTPITIDEHKMISELDHKNGFVKIDTKGFPVPENMPVEKINTYLGTLLGNTGKRLPYQYKNTGYYMVDKNSAFIREANQEITGEIPNVYHKKTHYQLKIRQYGKEIYP